MGVGDRIKLLRGNILQDEFARRVNVHKNTVGRWEREQRKPDSEDLASILNAFPDISPTWLLTGEGSMRRPDTNGHVANGNNIIQGAHIDAEEVHLQVQHTSTESFQQKPGYPVNYLDVEEDLTEILSGLVSEKIKEYGATINQNKMIILMMTLFKIYSRNFRESASFRREIMEKTVDNLVRLALPDNKGEM